MSAYDLSLFLPLCGGLTLLGLIASWFAWRRRGAAAGLRGVAWSLLPLAVYLLGVAKLLWRFGSAVVSFAGSFVFSPLVWSGVAVTGLSLILFAVSGRMRQRRARKSAARPGGRQAAQPPGRPAVAAPPAPASPGKPAKRKAAVGEDDDLGDVADILRRHGIR